MFYDLGDENSFVSSLYSKNLYTCRRYNFAVKTGQQSAILTKENPVFRLQDVIFRLFGQFGGFLKNNFALYAWNGINKTSWSFYEEKMINFGF